MRTLLNFLLLYGNLLILAGCEPFYEPVGSPDVPSSPGSAWKSEPIRYRETAENPFSAADLSKTMPLSLLVNMALFNNPATRASWNAARASAYAYHASFSPYYPTIVYSGSLNAQTNKGTAYASSGQNIVTGGSSSNSASASTQSHQTNLSNSLNLSYLLLDFGGRSANTDLALQILHASDWTHDLTMQQVILSVLTSYIALIENKGLAEAYQQDVRDYQTALQAAELLHAAGLATLTDVLLARSNLETARANLIQAQGGEKTALGQVLIAAGLPPDLEVSVEDLPQKLPVIEVGGSISALLEVAKEKRPDLGVAIAAIKQQEAQLAISYSNSMPVLTANGNWNQIRFIWPKAPSAYNEIASVQLNVPIFEGFFYLNQQRQLRAQIEQAMANLDVQLAAIYTQVVTYYYMLKSAEGALPSAEAALEYSQRAYRGFVAQYKTGTASILDVMNALTTLSNARSQLILIRSQWASALANLAFSVGMLGDAKGEWLAAPPSELEKTAVYRNLLKIWDLDLAKAPGFDLPKKGLYFNIDPFLEVKSRELSLRSKTEFSIGFGIKDDHENQS